MWGTRSTCPAGWPLGHRGWRDRADPDSDAPAPVPRDCAYEARRGPRVVAGAADSKSGTSEAGHPMEQGRSTVLLGLGGKVTVMVLSFSSRSRITLSGSAVITNLCVLP